MRKLLVAFVMLFGCLTFVGQAVASATAGYSDCCLHGCAGTLQCADAACQGCALPQPALLPDTVALPAHDGRGWHSAALPLDAGPARGPWRPPD